MVECGGNFRTAWRFERTDPPDDDGNRVPVADRVYVYFIQCFFEILEVGLVKIRQVFQNLRFSAPVHPDNVDAIHIAPERLRECLHVVVVPRRFLILDDFLYRLFFSLRELMRFRGWLGRLVARDCRGVVRRETGCVRG